MRGPGPTAEEEGGREWLSPEVEEGGGEGGRKGMRELLRDAWSVNGREVVERYYELGRRDAQAWVDKSEYMRRKLKGGGGLMNPFL
jgi:hypothetical protein